MAARLDPASGVHSRLVDLRELRADDLAPLLDEEISAWRAMLHWDFGKSADLVRRFVDMRALNGFALMAGRETAGYAYYVLEDHKGLIGDLFVRNAYRSAANERSLLESVLGALVETSPISRIESQLMMTRSPDWRSMPLSFCLSGFERNFMMLEMDHAVLGPPRRASAANRFYIDKWSEHHQEPAAQLIAGAYQGHVDSLINDQYRSVAGARRFLYNIVQYPGCGAFFKPASLAAFERLTGRIAGMCLASLVMPDCGHITQICVAPWARGVGLGYESLRQSLTLLETAGCRRTSLTVTGSNRDAIKLYGTVALSLCAGSTRTSGKVSSLILICLARKITSTSGMS